MRLLLIIPLTKLCPYLFSRYIDISTHNSVLVGSCEPLQTYNCHRCPDTASTVVLWKIFTWIGHALLNFLSHANMLPENLEIALPRRSAITLHLNR